MYDSCFIFGSSRLISISAFSSLVGIPIGVKSSEIGSKNCAITPGITKYKSKIQKRKAKHDKTEFYKNIN